MQKRLTVKELKAALVDVPDGQKFEDTGETGVDYFEIYGNAVQSDDF